MPSTQAPQQSPSPVLTAEVAATQPVTGGVPPATVMPDPTPTWFDNLLNFMFNLLARAFSIAGYVLGGSLKTLHMLFANAKINLPAILNITAKYANKYVRAVIGVAGILWAAGAQGATVAASLLSFTALGLSFPVMLVTSLLFAGVMSGFKFHAKDPNHTSFAQGFAMFWAPFTMLLLETSRPILVNLGVLRTVSTRARHYNSNDEYDAERIENPFASTETLDHFAERFVEVVTETGYTIRDSANDGYATGEHVANTLGTIAADMRTQTANNVRQAFGYAPVPSAHATAAAREWQAINHLFTNARQSANSFMGWAPAPTPTSATVTEVDAAAATASRSSSASSYVAVDDLQQGTNSPAPRA